MKAIWLGILVLFSAVTVAEAEAATSWFGARPTKQMITESDRYGGCLIGLSATISETLDCPDSWVTADCSGELGGSRTEARQKYDAVSLAAVAGKPMVILINDAKKIDGLCFVERVQVSY